MDPIAGGSDDDPKRSASRAAAAMAAQRLAQVEALVESRLELLMLLRRVHSAEAGDPVYWADSVLLSQRDLREFYKTPEATTR